MTAPTSLLGMVDDTQYGTIVADVYEHIPALYYPASVPVFAEMRRDSRLAAVVDGYGLQIRRAQWQLDGTGCRPEVTQFVADCLGLNVAGEDKPSGFRRRGVSWNDHLRSALLSEVFGHYAFELAAEIDDRGRARLATLAERIPATITNIHADPKTGDLLGIDQQIVTSRQRGPQIPADRLVFYSRNREGASWQGTSLLRPAYAPWLLKREMMRVAAISNRRWGAGVPVAEALPGTNPSPEQLAAAQRMASAARAGDQAGAAVPPGFTMKIVGLSGSIPDTVGFIRLLNQEMSGSVLMPHLDLGSSETGARALGESFIDSWTLALESEAEAIADTVTRQCAARIVDWNWGEDEPVPRVVVSGIGSRREITAESLNTLLSAGALSADPKLEAWVRREYRLPERDPNTPKPLPAGAPARPGRPQDGQDDQQQDAPGEERVEASGGDVVHAHLAGRHNQADHGRRKGKTRGRRLPEQRKGQLATSITSGVASRERIGLSAVDRVRFNDGREAIVRRHASRNEVASAEAAAALGAPVAATVQRGDDLFQEVAPGMQAWRFSNRVASRLAGGEITDPAQALADMKADSQALVDLLRGDAGKRAGLFDYLTGQSDRHMSNWLVAEDGKSFTLIDHDLSFGKTISPFAEHWAGQTFTEAETAEVLDQVRGLRPTFVRLGMDTQYAEMLSRAEYLHEHGRFDSDVIVANKLNREGKPI